MIRRLLIFAALIVQVGVLAASVSAEGKKDTDTNAKGDHT